MTDNTVADGELTGTIQTTKGPIRFRLFADEALNRTEDNLTIPATCLEAC